MTKPKPPLESAIQKQITNWLAATAIFWARMPVGPVMQGTGFKTKNKLKGFPDLFGVLSPMGRMWCIEVKRPGGKLTDEQKQWQHDLSSRGVLHAVCYSLDDAIETFRSWCG